MKSAIPAVSVNGASAFNCSVRSDQEGSVFSDSNPLKFQFKRNDGRCGVKGLSTQSTRPANTNPTHPVVAAQCRALSHVRTASFEYRSTLESYR
jgi:hypothetical protein